MRATALVLAVVAGAAAARADAPLAVAATIQPVALLVAELGGERVAVAALVPPGASPHLFEPRPADLAKLAGVRLLVEVGGDLDAWVARLRGAAGGEMQRLVLLETPGLDPLPAHGPPSTPADVEGAPAGSLDPHVWLDPIRVRDALAPALASRLAELDPAGRAVYAARLAAFQATLGALDAEIRGILAGRGRRYVAFHAAWRYFGARYGLEEVAVIEPAPGEEPTPRALAELVAAARRHRVSAVLVEPQLSPRVAEVLASELGLALVTVDPQGDPSDPERAGYVPLLRWNARAFAHALGGSAP